jgi:uncharacterized membrane protein
MVEKQRVPALDLWRGLIMVVMAVDHVSAFVARRHPAEFWGAAWTRYDSAAWFLTRFVTHICAPGFFFLMGAGIALFAASRQRLGWSGGRTAGYLFRRGWLLLAVNQLIENPAWVLGLFSGNAPGVGEAMPGSATPPYGVFTVLTGLGLSIVASSLLLRFRDWAWWLAGVGAVLVSAVCTPAAAHAADHFPVWLRLLLLPGQSGRIVVLYSLVPWFGLTALGVLFGCAT